MKAGGPRLGTSTTSQLQNVFARFATTARLTAKAWEDDYGLNVSICFINKQVVTHIATNLHFFIHNTLLFAFLLSVPVVCRLCVHTCLFAK